MGNLKYKLTAGHPVVSLTSGEDVYLQVARQMQASDWVEWPSLSREARSMLKHLFNMEKVPFIVRRYEGAMRIIVKQLIDEVA